MFESEDRVAIRLREARPGVFEVIRTADQRGTMGFKITVIGETAAADLAGT
jgi:hypothetical protein